MKRIILFLAIAATAFVSCKKSGSEGSSAPIDRLRGILLGDTLDMYVGETRQLPIVLTPTDYHIDSIKWKSSDTTVISISTTGLISAKKIGGSIITVSNLTNTISVNTLVTVVPAPVDSLKLGLIAYYPFNNSAADLSGNGNNGTANNVTATTDRFGNANAAYQFDGTSSFIEVKDNAALRLSNTNYTINYWVNLAAYSSTTGSAVLEKNSGAGQQGWNCGITGTGSFPVGVPFLNESGGNDPFAAGLSTIAVNTWTMVTISYSVTDQAVYFYINGKLNNVVLNIPTPNKLTNVDLFIGKNSYVDVTGNTPAYYIQGKLDDIRIYGRRLYGTEIRELYNLTN